MTNSQAKAIFNKAIAATTDADAIARLELVREYCTNPAFKAALEEHVWAANQ